ncbi:hypothetical protein POM88_019924 [Heracleum sosnowskyi]|uniref:Replication factor A C-terminal domain-containing protein n=1 Tax=Heracleum sosnowskyi TaxID=360622 RepID=A0AAD8MRJ8_9APIA|nr:hypothetical protein POM88_019924 [Heracleum sosnowskyi]
MRGYLSMKDYYSYSFQIRENEGLTPRLGGRLFQQHKEKRSFWCLYWSYVCRRVSKKSPQKQVKFTITDGRSSVNVTFWDGFAEKFQEEMNKVSEIPVIVIIASSRVGLWNDKVDLSSVGGTMCYLNYNHYSVLQLRKKLTEPLFSQQISVVDKNRELELLKVEAIKRLGKDYIMREVCTHVTIKSIEETHKWYSTVCTDCDQEIELKAAQWFCMNCNCILPYPDQRFNITAVASDETGTFQLSLADQPTRAVLEKRAVQLLKEVEKEEAFPADFKKLKKENFTVKIIIREVNVLNNVPIYKVISICRDFIDPNSKDENSETMETDKTQASTSTYHLDGMSQLNFQSPMNTKTSRE